MSTHNVRGTASGGLIDRLRGNAGNLEPFASIMTKAADALESQAREIAGLQKLLDRAHMRMDELKTQPSGAVPVAAIEALNFYANGDHLLLADPDAWDTCSGEPMNFLHDEAGTASVEDGSIAKSALERLNQQPASGGDDATVKDCLTVGVPVYQLQCREIGEGDWCPADLRHYTYCQKSPEMDTRIVEVQQARAALPVREAVAEGRQWVPVESTEEMQIAAGRDDGFCHCCGYDNGGGDPACVWRAMLAAAPSPSRKGE